MADVKQRIGVIYGPTAVGKTGVSLEIAEALGAEILSADSLAIYRGLDIGTAKPTPEERARVPHHLVDILPPDAPFTAADFAQAGREILRDCHARGVPLLVVGGTGLYIRSLLKGLFEGPEASPELRAQLREEEAARPGAMHTRLEAADPETAARLHPRDLIRLERALEVFLLSGRPLSDWLKAHAAEPSPYDVMALGLTLPREMLYERIGRRIDAMMAAGLMAEVQGLLAQGYSPDLKPLGALGYLHMCRAIAGEVDLKEAIRTLRRDTRRYAKRQLTWMNGWPTLERVDARERGKIAAELTGFLK